MCEENYSVILIFVSRSYIGQRLGFKKSLILENLHSLCAKIDAHAKFCNYALITGIYPCPCSAILPPFSYPHDEKLVNKKRLKQLMYVT